MQVSSSFGVFQLSHFAGRSPPLSNRPFAKCTFLILTENIDSWYLPLVSEVLLLVISGTALGQGKQISTHCFETLINTKFSAYSPKRSNPIKSPGFVTCVKQSNHLLLSVKTCVEECEVLVGCSSTLQMRRAEGLTQNTRYQRRSAPQQVGEGIKHVPPSVSSSLGCDNVMGSPAQPSPLIKWCKRLTWSFQQRWEPRDDCHTVDP